MPKTRKLAQSCLTVLLLGVGFLFVTATPAAASSYKCAAYGVGIKYGVRNGSFCDTVHGSGTYVETVTGTFGAKIFGLDQVCNPSMKMDVYDRWGNWITWRQGAQRSGCFPGAVNTLPTISVWWDFPQARCGYVKVTLQSYGNYVAENRHGLAC